MREKTKLEKVLKVWIIAALIHTMILAIAMAITGFNHMTTNDPGMVYVDAVLFSWMANSVTVALAILLNEVINEL